MPNIKVKLDPKFRIMNYVQDSDENRNFLFIAVELLKNRREIIEFFDEYCQWMKENGETEETRKEYLKVAGDNIGYILGYYDKEIQKRWFGALENIQHPIFGRNLDVKPEDAFEAGVQWASKIKSKKKVNKADLFFKKISSMLPRIK